MPEQNELTYSDVLRFLVRGLKYSLVAAVIAAAVTYMLSDAMSPQFQAEARLLLTQPNQEISDLLGPFAAASTLDSVAYQQAATTKTVLLEALHLAGVAAPSLEDASDLEERTNVTVEDGRNSSIVTISVKSGDADLSTSTANAIAASLLAWEHGRATTTMDRTIGLLEEQIARIDAAIAEQPNASSTSVAEMAALRDAQSDRLVLARSRVPGGISSLEWLQEALGPAPQVVPRPILYAVIAFIAAIIAAYATMLIASASSSRIRNLDELADVAGVPVLAAYGKGFLRSQAHDPYEALAFLSARLNLSFQRYPTKLMLVGTDERVDTRDLALALAKSFAEGGRNTLFIGSDLRRPLVRVGFGQSPSIASLRAPSLEQHLLSPHVELEPNKISTGSENLDLIVPTRVIRSATQLIARGFTPMLGRVQGDYDIVLVDAAPLTTAPDALTIAPGMSGILLVVKFARLKRETLTTALTSLGPLRKAVVGIIAMDLPGGTDVAVTHSTDPVHFSGGVDVVTRTAAN